MASQYCVCGLQRRNAKILKTRKDARLWSIKDASDGDNMRRYGKDGKVEAIKEFMELLYEKGIIIRTRKNYRQFDLYCKWAGGIFVRIKLDHNRVAAACVSSAIFHSLDKFELMQKIVSMYKEELLRQQQLS